MEARDLHTALLIAYCGPIVPFGVSAVSGVDGRELLVDNRQCHERFQRRPGSCQELKEGDGARSRTIEHDGYAPRPVFFERSAGQEYRRQRSVKRLGGEPIIEGSARGSCRRMKVLNAARRPAIAAQRNTCRFAGREWKYGARVR